MTKSLKTKALLTTAAIAITAVGSFLAVYETHHADASAPPAMAAAPQAVPVGVNVLKQQPVRIWSEFSGRLQAVDFAQVRPEVSGKIMEVRFQDGQVVKTGDILFVIDPSPYQAAVAKAQANLASTKTNADFAKVEVDRASGLVGEQAISRSLFDQRANAHRTAQAAKQAAEAALQQAQLDLDHAYVRAPISGRLSRAEITVGNLVQASVNAPLLTSIASTGGIYADFEIDEQTYLRGIRPAGGAAAESIPVELTVQGDDAHSYKGHIQSFDNHIDTASGTIRARAIFANDDNSLMPGMTVSVRVANGGDSTALLVPQGAVGTDQGKKFVLTAGADNKVAYREIALGQQVGDKRIVLSGLSEGDRVIVDGIQHVRPDALVDAKEVPDTEATVQP